MISRNEILSSIEEARLTHVKWVGDSKKLLDGDDLEYVQAPLRCTECAFGRWFYAEWQQLSNIPGFKNIEKIHNLFQRYYEALYFRAPSVHKSKGIFASKKLQEEQSQELTMDFNRLEKQSILLIQLLEQIAKVVSAMSDRLFERSKYRTA